METLLMQSVVQQIGEFEQSQPAQDLEAAYCLPSTAQPLDEANSFLFVFGVLILDRKSNEDKPYDHRQAGGCQHHDSPAQP